MKRFYSIFTLFSFLLGLSVSGFAAAETDSERNSWVSTDVSRTRLIASTTAVNNTKEILVGLQIQLDPGWKTYWRSPGDSGLPPQFNWSDSQNIKSVEVLWPKPQAFDSFGFLTWGYKNEVVFPIKVTLKDPQKALTLKLQVFYGVCAEVCIPVNQGFTLQLPPDGGQDHEDAEIIKYFQSQVPSPLREISSIQNMSFHGLTENQFVVEINSNSAFHDPSLILEGQDGDYFTISNAVLSENRKFAKFSVDANLVNTEKSLKGRRFTATIIDASIAVEGQARVE